MEISTVLGNVSFAATLMEFLRANFISDRKNFEILLKRTIYEVCNHVRQTLLMSSEFREALPSDAENNIYEYVLSEFNSGRTLSPDNMCANLHMVPQCVRLSLSKEIYHSLNESFVFCQTNSLFKLMEDMDWIKKHLHTAEELLFDIKRIADVLKAEAAATYFEQCDEHVQQKVVRFIHNQKICLFPNGMKNYFCIMVLV